jgi:hypothetical protein
MPRQIEENPEELAAAAAKKRLIAWLRDGEADAGMGMQEAFDGTREVLKTLLEVKPTESKKKEAEWLLWQVLTKFAVPFSCGDIGYLLFGDGVPVAVSSEDLDFRRLLIVLGVHPGSPNQERIGEFIGTMCRVYGVRTETRLAFHFDPETLTAYAAARRGMLIKVTMNGLEEAPNGTDGQLFLFPDSWRPLLTKPLDDAGGEVLSYEVDDEAEKVEDAIRVSPAPGPGIAAIGSDMCTRALFADGFLARHLFGGTSFEIRSMDEKQVRILIMAYVMFLMMPGVASERAMLQCLGPSGSGKTFLLELIGRLLLGPAFMVRALPVDIKEFENQIINEYLVAYDNVGHVPAAIKDRLCQAVTGIEVVRRELYTTAKEARFKSRATIALSAIAPPLPELEHANRTVSINFTERSEATYIAKEELFKVVDRNRDELVLDLLRRMTLVLEALQAQRDYVPRVSVRLASIATFILRVARHENWEERAKRLLDAWSGEQLADALDEDDVSEAISRWMSRATWVPGQWMTATMLNEVLVGAMVGDDMDENLALKQMRARNLSWDASPVSLAKKLGNNFKVYKARFGLERGKSRFQNSRGTKSYRFVPDASQMAEARERAAGFLPDDPNLPGTV